ncbi:MAG: dTDP-4-dehydrorhamnose 3,5-epimerase [Acidobacteria bacterium]|nr:dTDP-4-dehydrorhamnose 3,5-epimerase [Acidobacteriota bacterium]MCW5969370.1 dTDP-4-dehydrorhamnose 3,5-epimerase [Blastocatellales bacterium]
MKFIPTEMPGVILVEPQVFRDARGFFLETYQQRKFAEGGIDVRFVQDNHSRSSRGTLRGLHLQRTRMQGKLIRAVQGEIYDVAVDVRRNSPSYKKWLGVTLSAENFLQLYIPPGFAHGFCVTSETAEIEYKCTDYYAPDDELTVLWNDPSFGIDWPVSDPLLSAKDRAGRTLDDIEQLLPRFEE